MPWKNLKVTKKKLTGNAAQTFISYIESSVHSMPAALAKFESCINGGRGGGGKWNFGGGPGPSHASSPQSKKSLSNIFHIYFEKNTEKWKKINLDFFFRIIEPKKKSSFETKCLVFVELRGLRTSKRNRSFERILMCRIYVLFKL